MVFPGKLSTGCHICRKRKVKCDGAKPECHRCVQHGVRCTGYPDKFSFREYRPPRQARSEVSRKSTAGSSVSASSQQSVTMVKSPRSRKGHSPSGHASLSSDGESAIVSASEPSPSTALSLCPDWESLCSFMHQIVFPAHRSPCGGYLAFLPTLYKKKGHCDPGLKHAILSVSYLMRSNRPGARELHVKARKNYGLSLKYLNEALLSPERATEDETLAACLLLSMFFNLLHEGKTSCDPHMSGISDLFHLRKPTQIKNQYTRYLICWIIIQIQIQAIVTNKFQDFKMPIFIQALPKPDCIFRAAILNNTISQFCQSISDLRDTIPAQFESNEIGEPQRKKVLKNILERASYVMNEIEFWLACIPNHWKKQYSPEAISSSDGWEHTTTPSDQTPAPDPWTISFLSTAHCAQIIFYLQVLPCCEELRGYGLGFAFPQFPGGLDELCHTLQERIKFLLKTICFIVSATVGSLDSDGVFHPRPSAQFASSNTMFWPMWAIVICPLATTHQVEHCRQALDFIGRSFGHRLAYSLSKQACASTE